MSLLNRRHFLGTSVAAAGAAYSLWPAQPARAAANDEVHLGFISCGGRSGELSGAFEKVPGVVIAGLCDPDSSRVESAHSRYPKAKTWTDMRDMLQDPNIDAVVISTCNHWHCLAAIWAMQAGKHVYVEKPLSHSQWEGRQTVSAARKYKRVCQVGTQQRSDPMQAEIKKFLHEDKVLGEIQSARVNRYGVRGSIGKRDTPLPIEKNVNYDLWLGPAADEPIYRDKLHYDWHWDWNTGSGEMGNWGVHVLDDLRNNVFQDSVRLPQRILGGGGRVAWNDAGETPNVHFVYFDTGKIPVVIGLSNLTAGGDSNKSPSHPGPGSGYIAYCEGGRLEGQRGSAVAFDKDGKEIRRFRGNSGGRMHQENFIDAVRNEDPSRLNTEVEVGHYTTGWCNLANIAYRAGQPFQYGDAAEIKDDVWQSLLKETEEHLAAHGVKMESTEIVLSPILSVDEESEQFVGAHADAANSYLRREYRAGYEVPEI
jgi:predicted dehydrogenase